MVGRSLFSAFAKSVRTLAALGAVLLTGSAVAATGPAFTLTTPATATFPATATGATSAAQTIVLTTTRAVTISSIAVAQTVNAHQEFTVGTMTGCTIGTATATAAVCSIPVTFSPYYTGIRQQALTVTDSTGLVYTVGLQGYGGGPQTLLTPTSINTTGGASPGPFYSGDGGAASAGRFGFPEGVYIDASNNTYIADFSTNNVRVIYQAGAALACLIQIEEPTLFGLPAGSTSCAGATSAPVAGSIYTLAGDTTVYASTTSTHPTGKDNGVLAAGVGAATLYSPSGVTVDSNGNVIIANYGNFMVRVIYSGGDNMACLIEVENPTLFGLSASATSCAGATSAPQQGYIYTLANVSGTAGITGDGAKASLAAMANLYAVAISKDGDIYVADDSTQAARTARIRVIYNGGAQAAALIAATNPSTTPVFGNIYRVAGGTQISGGDGGLATSGGLLFSRGVAVDADGDVLFTDYNGAGSTFTSVGKVRVIYNGGATMANLIKLENPSITPIVGYLYTLAGNSGVVTTPAAGNGGLASAATFTLPYGLTVDPAGDIFVADYSDHTIRKIQSSDGIIYAYAGTSAAASSTAVGNALTTGRFWDPFGIALGSSGTVIVGDYGIYRVKNVDITPAAITFATPVQKGSTGDPTYVYFLNQGTKPATIASVVASTNFTTLTVASGATPYTLDCTKITTLAPGAGCAVAVAVQPTVGGTLTGTLTITDNSNGSSAFKHSVALSGTSGIQTVVTLTSSAAPTYAGNTVTYTAVVAAAAGQDLTGAPALIGTVAFTDGTAIPGSPVTIDATGTATITEGPLAAGTHSIKAVFTPDSTIATTYATATSTLSEVVTAVATTTTVSSSLPNADQGASVTLTARVAITAGQTIPTGAPSLAGTVTFTDSVSGSTLAANVPISAAGVASTPAITTLAVGTHTITAVFTPSSIFYASSTGTLSQIVSAPMFSISTSALGVAVTTGGTVPVPFSIISVGGYKGTVTGSCSSLPANMTCKFAPASVSFTGADNTLTDTVTIAATSQSAAASHTGRTMTELAGLFGTVFLLMAPRRRRFASLLMLVFGLALATGLTGCGNGTNNATRGTTNINVTFTDGATSYTQAITVSVVGSGSN